MFSSNFEASRRNLVLSSFLRTSRRSLIYTNQPSAALDIHPFMAQTELTILCARRATCSTVESFESDLTSSGSSISTELETSFILEADLVARAFWAVTLVGAIE